MTGHSSCSNKPTCRSSEQSIPRLNMLYHGMHWRHGLHLTANPMIHHQICALIRATTQVTFCISQRLTLCIAIHSSPYAGPYISGWQLFRGAWHLSHMHFEDVSQHLPSSPFAYCTLHCCCAAAPGEKQRHHIRVACFCLQLSFMMDIRNAPSTCISRPAPGR